MLADVASRFKFSEAKEPDRRANPLFTVKRIEVIHYWRDYSRDEVLDLMSLSDLDGQPSPDIRAEYESLSDDELALAFHAELRQGGNATTDAVYESTERYGDVQGNDFSVELSE